MLIDVPIHLIYQKNLEILTNCHQRNVYNIFRSGVVASPQFIRDSNSNSMRKTYRNLKETISLVLENQVRPKETLTIAELWKDLLHGETHCHGSRDLSIGWNFDCGLLYQRMLFSRNICLSFWRWNNGFFKTEIKLLNGSVFPAIMAI